jgi:Arc/MetJ family transcription regulator
MKMTMHIDEALLKRVMRDYDCKTKTETVEMALTKLDRRARLRDFVKTDSGITAEEWKNSVDPGYDPKKISHGISEPAISSKK